jgi:hypothetical protein
MCINLEYTASIITIAVVPGYNPTITPALKRITTQAVASCSPFFKEDENILAF